MWCKYELHRTVASHGGFIAGRSKFYITTAIPYVNAAPHLGHALEFVQTDAIARYHKSLGEDVFLTTGSDENSLKNVRAAEKLGITPALLCEKNAKMFRELAEKIELSFDSFVRSSVKEEHWKGPEMLWELCNKSGDIYTKMYSGLYCVECEEFYMEKELIKGLCPEHGIKPEIVEEENYFFRLSKYQKQIEELISKDELRIMPESRKSEMLTFVKEGLQDFSVSRSVKRAKGWGVPVPGDQSQIMFVWFDALAIYLTGIGYPQNKEKFEKYWPADVHVIGKGITRFHALYWPGILMSAGLALPKNIFIHGYITVNGQKMSKSIGNVLDPLMLIDKYGAEKLRYYLLKSIPTFEDGDFSETGLVEAINNELVGNLGNFIHRSLTFIWNNYSGKLGVKKLEKQDEDFLQKISTLEGEATKLLGECRLHEAMLRILEIGNDANKYFQSNAPWELIKTDKENTERILFVCWQACGIIVRLLYPYTPSSSEKLLNILGTSTTEGIAIKQPYIVFDKIK
ncbi:MAG: methionine--tRNA ligase [Candidatus Micrarchaeales archaeon]